MVVVGSQIGSYRIERTLGEGGMGVVYVGVDVRLGRRAAIKQLLPELSGQRDVVERFFNEAKATANINHPGIVEIYEVGWHSDGSAYFAMKLLEGDSLARRLRAGPMSLGAACVVARQIASALAAAHAAGIVHRDLKPDNIVLVRDDEVELGERATILDFGIAKLTGEQPMSHRTRTGSVIGTPSYMSPEQCRSAGEVDHRTDVYAMGCILFEMLTGRPPFVGAGAGEVIGMHQFVPPPTLRSLRGDASPELEALVSRCLAKPLDQRFQTMPALMTALQACSPRIGSVDHAARAAVSSNRLNSLTNGPPTIAPLPSTLVGGRGEVITQQPSKRKRGPLVGLLGGSAAAAIAVVAAIVVRSGGLGPPVVRGAHGDDAGPPDGVLAIATVDEPKIATATTDAALIATTPVDAAPDGDRPLLAEANQAEADQRWQDLSDIARRILERDPTNATAKELVNRATIELANQTSYQKLTQQLAIRQLAAALSSYRAISEDSAYYAHAEQAIDNAIREFVTETHTHAQSLAAQHRCAELKRLAIEAGNVSPEVKAAANLPCKDMAAVIGPTPSRRASEDSKTPPDGGTAHEPVGVASDLPDSIDRVMIAEGLARIKNRVMSCGDEFELKGQVKVSVKVAPDGHVTSAYVKETAEQVLGDCVLRYMNKATFTNTQRGGTFSYSYNFSSE